MSDLMHKNFNLLRDQLQQKEDSIICQVISDYIGHDDWLRERISNQGHWLVNPSRPKERTLIFNGIPLLWMHDPEMVQSDDPYTIRYEQKYKVLFNKEEHPELVDV